MLNILKIKIHIFQILVFLGKDNIKFILGNKVPKNVNVIDLG